MPEVFDVLCAGFACTDMSFAVPAHPAADEKQRATSLAISGGGPAANAAVQVARLGGRAAFAGCIGNDALGRDLRTAFSAEGVSLDALVTTAEPTPVAAILIKPDGSRTVVSHRSPLKASIPDFPAARVVLIDGHRPEWTSALAEQLARVPSGQLVLDAGSFNEATRSASAVAHHIVASESFARTALAPIKVPLDEHTLLCPDHLSILAKTLNSRPNATWVVTLGAGGLIWHRENQYGSLPALPANVIDTNGAGDAFHGAYALALARGYPWGDTLRYARAAATLACTRAGSWQALARADEVAALLATSH